MPANAKTNDATGAANFVLYWVKVSNFAAVTGDTRRLRDLSASNCEGCNRYIDLYEKTYKAGGYFKGGNRTLRDVQVEVTGGGTYVSAILTGSPGTYRLRRSATEARSRAEETKVTFFAEFEGEEWTMLDIGLQSP